MDTGCNTPAWNFVYSLWHLPSSALLVTTFLRNEVEDWLTSAVHDGILLDDLMLQVTGEGELIGDQHIGERIFEALHDSPSPPEIAL